MFSWLRAKQHCGCNTKKSFRWSRCRYHTEEVLKQQLSDKGNDERFYETRKQGCATHGSWAKSGPGGDILWAVARGKGQIFKHTLRFLKGIASVGLRVL